EPPRSGSRRGSRRLHMAARPAPRRLVVDAPALVAAHMDEDVAAAGKLLERLARTGVARIDEGAGIGVEAQGKAGEIGLGMGHLAGFEPPMRRLDHAAMADLRDLRLGAQARLLAAPHAVDMQARIPMRAGLEIGPEHPIRTDQLVDDGAQRLRAVDLEL